jgi:tetratricopeptide (TPR) repeat protein
MPKTPFLKAGARALPVLAAAVLAWAAGGFAAGGYRSPFPPPSEMRAPAAGVTGDMLALALGTRRIFADLWFIRLMQYYGSREFSEYSSEPGHEGHAHSVDEQGHAHCAHGANFGKGNYPQFLPMARHVLEVDPYFSAAGLYGAASLAFSLERAGEAEELLRYGLKYSPRDWKYLNVLAAIGYSKAQDPVAVAETIAPLLKDPDCPVMLKQQAAFLNKKAGNYAAAAAIYADIAATSRDEAYVKNARRELERLSRIKTSPSPLSPPRGREG